MSTKATALPGLAQHVLHSKPGARYDTYMSKTEADLEGILNGQQGGEKHLHKFRKKI